MILYTPLTGTREESRVLFKHLAPQKDKLKYSAARGVASFIIYGAAFELLS